MMPFLRCIALAACLLQDVSVADGTGAAVTGSDRRTVPANAYRLPLSEKRQLQTVLDAHKTVVLEAGDYQSGGVVSITLKKGYQLYGDPVATKIPPVTVEPGTCGAVLGYVTTNAVTFPASSLVTAGNRFQSILGGITVRNGTLENNLFLDCAGAIYADTQDGGYLRNNRFIRWRIHCTSPGLTLLGDAAQQSYGNVFLWVNLLIPNGNTTDIRNYRDLTFVGLDGESWNFKGTGTDALIKTGTMGTLRMFTVNGVAHLARKWKTGIYDIGATEFQLYNDLVETTGAGLTDMTLRSSNQRWLAIGNRNPKVTKDEAPDVFRLTGFQHPATGVAVGGSNLTTALPATAQTTLKGMIHPVRKGTAWERPVHGAVPDPAGAKWKLRRDGTADSTAMIQGLIDKQGVARLPAGIYRISKPLKVARDHGIIGAGADTTAIIATDKTVDLIVADDPPGATTNSRIVLADITLQGGRNGLHLEPIGTSAAQGRIAQYHLMFMQHVTFRDMAEAGINMDRIYGLDNNFFDHVNFVNCGAGIKQITDPAWSGKDPEPNMAYIDKCVFYQSQFIGNHIALDMMARRPDQLNGWINCLFMDNRGGVAAMSNHLSPVFANCDFVNNGGAAVIDAGRTYPVSLVNCRLAAGTHGAAMFSGPVAVEGCVFDRAGSTTATIFDGGGGDAWIYNSTSANMPVGWTTGRSGLLMNNTFALDAALSAPVVLVRSGVASTLVPGTSSPSPQLLFGADFSTLPTPPANF